MSDMSYKLLEQKVTVMQNEISQVIGEMQVTVQGIVRMMTAALKQLDARLEVLEPKQEVSSDVPVVREGKDI